MMMGTYEIRNKLDGMAYGGSSGNIERRRGDHRRALCRGKHHCIRFQRAWNKYGKDAFEFIVLEVIEDAVLRLAAEQIWLDIHHAAGTCYNIAITAGPVGPISEEVCRKRSERMMGNQIAKGSGNTDKQRRENSERMMGNQYGLGYKHTEEWKRANSERMMGHPVSDATRQKIAATKVKPYPAFIHRDTDEIIPAGANLKRMCLERGLEQGHMHRVKTGKRSHHKGWALLSEDGKQLAKVTDREESRGKW